ncbi:CACTA en-spm transposon protein [Cucumis melo var. makuwa]|uniref:CACTA en-spm transposon protein n=1 Tax=Cucumis melo var. makuwa TaxID=1194695 RepID=A0A5A7UEM8_CUCMM|nr:CACTA en-spm transposon protein [Cucumis melo var. makuwa]TYK14586.1 CACTA en-spm transposon protein [Cucumis melo var. makuwa]
MLTVWKEFRGQNHHHLKKFDDPEQARANSPLRLSNQKQSLMNRAARAKQPYNHSSGVKLFLQRQHKLTVQRGHPINLVELFRKTHALDDQFVSQAAVDAHVKSNAETLVLAPRGFSTTQEMRYARPFWTDDQLAHAREVNELKTHFEVVEEESNRKHEESACLIEAQALWMEEMRKMIEDLSRASRGGP